MSGLKENPFAAFFVLASIVAVVPTIGVGGPASEHPSALATSGDASPAPAQASAPSAADPPAPTSPPGPTPTPAAPAPTPGWKLVWHDEFEKDGPPDPASWGHEEGFVRNNELQWYQRENAACKGGMLVIEARREKKPNPRYRPDARGFAGRPSIEVTSACLITKGKHEFTYGKIEMRARIDTRLGSWPAFWTLGAGRTRWPECGEVDIMEYYTGTVLANVCHALGGKQKWLTTKRPLSELGGEAWAKEFHVWTMEWDEKKIDLSLDGKLSAHFEVAGDDEPGKENAFRKPHYILLNQAIGGTSGGDPSRLEYPVRIEVDWVRVYERA